MAGKYFVLVGADRLPWSGATLSVRIAIELHSKSEELDYLRTEEIIRQIGPLHPREEVLRAYLVTDNGNTIEVFHSAYRWYKGPFLTHVSQAGTGMAVKAGKEMQELREVLAQIVSSDEGRNSRAAHRLDNLVCGSR